MATDIMGVSGRAMLEALIDGRDEPAALADLAKRRLRSKIGALTEALTGGFTAHHWFLIRMHLNLIDEYAKALDELDARIEEAMAPLRAARELLCSIPGVSNTVAEVFLAETGANMTVFPTAGHLASWAGTAPGSNESAGRVKSTKTRPGNRYLKGALGIAALAASRSKRTYFSAKYKRIASHRGPMKALVAVEHAMLVAAWNMLTNGEFYRDPGPDYYTRRVPAKTKARAVTGRSRTSDRYSQLMTDSPVTTVDGGARKVARRVLLHAPSADVFALIADPHRHPELDGSGTVRDIPVTGPERLSEGAKFSVGMRQYGVPYKITSTVTAFEGDHLIEWQHPFGHRWRWELHEIEPGTTQITETFDYSTAKSPKLLELFGQPAKNGVGITKTLEALAARFA